MGHKQVRRGTRLGEALPRKRSRLEQIVLGCCNSNYMPCNQYRYIAIIICNNQNPYDTPALNLEKKWVLMIVTSKSSMVSLNISQESDIDWLCVNLLYNLVI